MTDTLRFLSATDEVRVLEIVATNWLQTASVGGIVINGRDVTERNEYVTKLKASFDAVTIAIANAVELRDPYTAGHQREVAGMATAIARELALAEDDVKGIEVASTIHDIGKIAVPAEILTRPGKLNPAEFEIVKTHSQAGADVVADVPFPWPVAEMILQHHERLDGSGYPNALKGSARRIAHPCRGRCGLSDVGTSPVPSGSRPGPSGGRDRVPAGSALRSRRRRCLPSSLP